jgi:hypothetical protein
MQNTMYMLVGLWSGRITVKSVLANWGIVLVSNFAGCVATVYYFGYLTELHKPEPFLSWVKAGADNKINLPPHVAFLRAIPANALVCTSVLFGLAARDMFGKIAGIWIPFAVFVLCGFEHCIANMAWVPLGLFYGAESTWWRWLFQNLPLVIIGNVLGGGLLSGAAFLLFDWTKVDSAVGACKNEDLPENDMGSLLPRFLSDLKFRRGQRGTEVLGQRGAECESSVSQQREHNGIVEADHARTGTGDLARSPSAAKQEYEAEAAFKDP